MSALKSHYTHAQHVEDIRQLASKVIQRPVKLTDADSKQKEPVAPHQMHDQLEVEYSKKPMSRREICIQVLGVITITLACWSLGFSLYGQL